MSSSRSKDRADPYVDVQAHVLPDFYLGTLEEAGINDIDGWPFPDWGVETTLQAMDSHKITTQVLSLSSPGVSFLSGQKTVQLARRLNEFQAKLVEDHAPYFGSLAVLPLPDVETSLAEIGYAFGTIGRDGVGLLTDYHGLYLGDPRIDAVFAELDRRKAALFVHSTEPLNFNTFNIGLSVPVQEFVFDSTRMAQNFVQTGTKAKYPDITIIIAHGGGTLPYTGQRLVRYAMGGKNDIFSIVALELTAATEPEQIRPLIAPADSTQCFMGFDHPFTKLDWSGPLQKTLEPTSSRRASCAPFKTRTRSGYSRKSGSGLSVRECVVRGELPIDAVGKPCVATHGSIKKRAQFWCDAAGRLRGDRARRPPCRLLRHPVRHLLQGVRNDVHGEHSAECRDALRRDLFHLGVRATFTHPTRTSSATFIGEAWT